MKFIDATIKMIKAFLSLFIIEKTIRNRKSARPHHHDAGIMPAALVVDISRRYRGFVNMPDNNACGAA